MKRPQLHYTIIVAALLLLAPSGLHSMTVREAVVDRLLAMYGLDSATYEIEVLSCPLKSTDVNLDDLALYPLTSKEPLGLFTAVAKITQGESMIESGQVRMKIYKFADVLVATARIRNREPVAVDKVCLRRMDITSLCEQPLVSLSELVGMRSRRNLRPGKILTTAALEPIPDVESGRDLSIVFVDGVCRITAAGVALESGLAGEYIRVKNKSSGKTIVARIVDGSAVAVDP
ncbi:MAG: flagellar basal body P-ring formation chaperone FlgA [Candidatus Zixiibacteriota bacterium]